MKALGALGHSVTAQCEKNRSRYEVDLLREWNAIVGSPLCQWCRPLSLSFSQATTSQASAQKGRSHGKLNLIVLSAYALDVSQLSPQIIAKVNGYFGYPMIAKLGIIQRYSLGELQNSLANPRKSCSFSRSKGS